MEEEMEEEEKRRRGGARRRRIQLEQPQSPVRGRTAAFSAVTVLSVSNSVNLLTKECRFHAECCREHKSFVDVEVGSE